MTLATSSVLKLTMIMSLLLISSGCSDDDEIKKQDTGVNDFSQVRFDTSGENDDSLKGSLQLGDPCCDISEQAAICEQPTSGTCATGLTCYVTPNGPYAGTGFCAASCADTTCPNSPDGMTCEADVCVFSCSVEDCTGDCQKGEGCPPHLTCRSTGGLDYCLP